MTVSTIPIPQIIKIGVLIGAKGCNLKPIAEDTVNEARVQLNNLINKLLKRSNHSIEFDEPYEKYIK
ncbi:1124_t:CDS:2, partial [Funneliformis mosseae]